MIRVIPSDTIPIPAPSSFSISGTNTGSGTSLTAASASVTGSISGSVLTVTVIGSGTLAIGMTVYDNASTPTYKAKIIAQLTGSAGSTGTYQLDTTIGTVASGTVLATAIDFTMYCSPGSTVYNTTDWQVATVTSVTISTVTLNTNIFSVANKAFSIYQTSSLFGTSNVAAEDGFILYIGGAGNLNIVTSGGDSVSGIPVTASQFFSQNVKQVLSTGTTATTIFAIQ